MKKPRLSLRPATMEDLDILFDWRNDPQTRNASHETKPITREEHQEWLTKTLNDKKRHLYIAELDGRRVGAVRADYSEDLCELSWTVAPAERGKGLGKRMVAMLAARIKGALRAEIKKGNAASVSIAEFVGMSYDYEKNGILYYSRAPLTGSHGEKRA